MTPEEPLIFGAVMKYDGHMSIAITHERSVLGRDYLAFARGASARSGLQITSVKSLNHRWSPTSTMLPAVTGAFDTGIRSGRHIRQGWMDSRCLVARRLIDTENGIDNVLHEITVEE